MRTLKKALSLVLVLAMVLSLGVSAFAVDNGSKLTDFEQVKNKEAVSVLTAIGVISGRDDGSYDPNGTFNRAEAATIIARMLLGPTVAAVLPNAATQFNDVPATHWANKYIAYCASEGIISGYGNGNFGPSDTLTATQWSLMLLKAINADGVADIGGTSWELSTTKLALNTKIAAADDLTNTFNRDAAAKLAFNGLNYSEKKETKTETKYVVSKDGETTIFDTFAEAQAAIVTASEVEGGKWAGGTLNSISVTSEKAIDSVGYKVFTLEKTSASADDYSRPGQGWQYKNASNKTTQIGTFAKEPVAAYTSTVSANDLYNALGASATIKGAVSTVNTTTAAAGYIKADGTTATADIAVGTNVSSGKIGLGGNGIITEIYETGVDNEYKVVQIQPMLTQVNSVRNVKATATVGAHTVYSLKNVTGTYDLFTSTVTSADKDTITINGTIAKDDYVMVYGANDKVVVTPVTLVEGNVSSYTSSTKTYTIGGTGYAMSAAAKAADVTATVPAVSATKGTFAVDAYGYVIGAVTLAAENYVYVLNASRTLQIDGNRATEVAEAAAINPDGELVSIIVSKLGEKTDVASIVTDLGAPTAGGNTKSNLYTYTLDSDGNYVLTAATGDKVKVVTSFKKGTPALAAELNANNATKFFIAQYNDKGTATSVTSYTGYNSVLSMSEATAKALDVNEDGIADVVFVGSAKETGVTTSYVYYTGNYSIVDNKTVYSVITKDGAAEDLSLTFADAIPAAGLYTIADGAATKVDTASTLDISEGTAGIFVSTIYLTYDNGLLKTSTDDGVANAYAVLAGVGDGVPVYYYDNGELDTSIATASDLASTDGSTVVITVNSAKTAIEAIYIVK